MSSFVHLHTHSGHHRLDAMGTVEQLVQAAVADGQTAMALTDHGSLSGAFAFYSACKAAGIKPILGMEAYFAIGSRFEPGRIEVPIDGSEGDAVDDGGLKTKANYHLTLLATSPRGWQSLVRLHNLAQDSFYGKPLADFDLLAECADDLLVLTGCLGGPVAGPLSYGNTDLARENLTKIIDAVGAENVYVEMMDHSIDVEADNPRKLRDLAAEFDLPVVVTNDCHYPHADQTHAHRGWTAGQSKKTLDDPKAFALHGTGYWVRTAQEMRDVYPNAKTWQAGIDETVKIAERCCDDPFAGLMDRKFPVYPHLEPGETEASRLYEEVKAGAVARYGTLSPEVKDRLRFELDTITDAGVAGYFLIGKDMVDFARESGIATGRGRGSVGGAVTAYALGLTSVEPLSHDLLFERFYEPGRTDMPDIDYDFEARRRGEILDYLVRTYGADKVARIGTVGVCRSRAALKSAGRVLGLGAVGSRLSDAVPTAGGKPYTFDEMFTDKKDQSALFFQRLDEFGDDGKAVLALAREFEGSIDSESIHACGTIVSDSVLVDMIPLRKDRSPGGLDVPVACWDGEAIEKFGYVKLDVLGLNNLDRVSAALDNVAETTGKRLSIDTVPDPDDTRTHGTSDMEATWSLLADAKSQAVFQLESDGMRELLAEVQPRSLDDLSAVLALYRPGPMSAGSTEAFAKRRSGAQKVDYSQWTTDPDEIEWLDTVLGTTFGLIVYQEQAMRLGTVVAGFDASGRSKLRKAIGKKKADLMAEVGRAFIEGAPIEHLDASGNVISPVFSKKTAKGLWEAMKGAAEYAFNQSHSATYGALSFVNSWLKANYPVEFGAAVLATVPKNAEKRRSVIESLAEDGIAVIAPDINAGSATTKPVDGAVMIGLSEIRDVGAVAHDIVAERERGGVFADLHDLVSRTKVNSLVLAGLTEAGALDAFGPRRGLHSVVQAMRAGVPVPVPETEWDQVELQARQRDRLGLTTSQVNVLAEHRDTLKMWEVPSGVGERDRGLKARPMHKIGSADGTVATFGVLADWTTTNGRANFTVEATRDSLDCVMWPRNYAKLERDRRIPMIGDVVAILGRKETRTFTRTTTDETTGDQVESTTTRTSFVVYNIWAIDTADDAPQVAADGPRIDWETFGRPTELTPGSDEPEPLPEPPSDDVAGGDEPTSVDSLDEQIESDDFEADQPSVDESNDMAPVEPLSRRERSHAPDVILGMTSGFTPTFWAKHGSVSALAAGRLARTMPEKWMHTEGVFAIRDPRYGLVAALRAPMGSVDLMGTIAAADMSRVGSSWGLVVELDEVTARAA